MIVVWSFCFDIKWVEKGAKQKEKECKDQQLQQQTSDRETERNRQKTRKNWESKRMYLIRSNTLFLMQFAFILSLGFLVIIVVLISVFWTRFISLPAKCASFYLLPFHPEKKQKFWKTYSFVDGPNGKLLIEETYCMKIGLQQTKILEIRLQAQNDCDVTYNK